MIFPRRGFLQLAAGTVALAAFAPIASAQTYPSRPITLVVPFPAAGPADVLARILAERMRETLGQPVVIENVTGAAGSIATGRVVRATADGHTIMLGNLGTHVVNGAIYPLQYDLAKDFEPISLLPSNHQLLIANKATPEKDLRELIARLKANPDKVTIGNAGPGSPSHFTAVYFQTAVGKNFQLVPYRGTPQELQDLIAGHIDLVFDHEKRIAGGFQSVERRQQRLGVRGIKSGGGLVEHIDDAEQIGTHLGCQSQALQFARGKRRGTPLQR